MTDTNTVKAIVEAAKASRAQLVALDHDLQGEIDKLVLGAAKQGRELNAEEKIQRRLLRTRQAEIEDAFEALAFVTVARLDTSDDVKQLADKLKSINANLNDDLERLRNIAAYAKIAAQVADGLAKLAEQVASAAAKA